jgi:hypothetical protein
MLTGVRHTKPLAGARGSSLAVGKLLFVLFHDDRFEVFSFKNLAAIETFDVVYAIAAGDDLGAVVVTGGLHKQRFIETYSNHV